MYRPIIGFGISKYLVRTTTSALLTAFLVSIASAALGVAQVASSVAERGSLTLVNYDAETLGGRAAVYGSASDARGVRYVVTGEGLREYDGGEWRYTALRRERGGRSLDADSNGVVYFGADDDLGYLAVDEQGKTRVVSLAGQLVAAYPEVGNERGLFIYHVVATPHGVAFNVDGDLFLWRDSLPRSGEGQFERFLIGESVESVAWVDGRLLASTRAGLFHVRMDGPSRLLDGTEQIGATPFSLASLGGANSLPRGNGVLLYSGTRAWHYDGQAATLFFDAAAYGFSSISSVAALPDGSVALGTEGDGVLFVDANGDLYGQLSEEDGLADEEVNRVDVADDGLLWIASADGLASVDPLAAITRFDATDGLGGRPHKITRHRGVLYVGTSIGLYQLIPSVNDRARFEPVPGVSWGVIDLQAVGDRLLAATDRGLYALNKDRLVTLGVSQSTLYALSLWPSDSLRVLYAGDDGAMSLRYDPSSRRWSTPDTLVDFGLPIRDITEGKKGERWFMTTPSGLARMTLTQEGADVVRFREEQGLPSGELIIAPYADGAAIQSGRGLLRYDAERDRFVPDSTFGPQFADGTLGFVELDPTPYGLWGSVDGEDIRQRMERYANDTRGLLQPDTPPGLRLMPSETSWDNYAETDADGDDVVWFGTTASLYRYEGAREYVSERATPLVRRVTMGEETLAFLADDSPTLDADHLPLRIAYALPDFRLPEHTRYQTLLDGIDSGWSAPTDETRRDYTNLPGGDYTFRVRALDVYGRVTNEATFTFSVRPPWYLTGWALALFGLLAAGLVWTGVRVRVAQLEERNADLQRTVDERTERIRQQNERLEAQTNQLREVDEAKTRFFANVSHELRTPLALLLGPLAELRAGHRGALPEQAQAELGVMARNGQRLHALVDQILKLTQIDAEVLALDLQPRELVAFARFHTELYDGLARHRDLSLAFESRADRLVCAFEPDAMDKMLGNLIGNALKFTPPGGRVTVTVDQDGADAVVRVADTGIGIPSHELDAIFDRFHQADDSATRAYEGTGIGLSLASELAHLHGGALTVESTHDEGSTFTLRLPLIVAEPVDATAPHAIASVVPDAEALAPKPSIAPPPEAPALTDEPDAETDRTTVLIVEDNADLRGFIRSILEPTYRVHEAIDGANGFDIARALLPDLIVSDVMMPRMDGLTMAERLRDNVDTSTIPLVLLTARATREDRVAGFETGAEAYVAKPFDSDQLRLQIGNLIARQYRLRDKLRSGALPVPEPESESSLVRSLHGAIEAHLTEPNFGIEPLADAIGLSRQQLHRRMRDELDQTPTAFLLAYRLERAAELLRARQGNVSEVAYAVGFNSQTYFSRTFRAHFGASPSAYVKDAV